MKLALVSTVYNGANTITEFLIELDLVLASQKLEKPTILHLVDDGSKDNSIEVIKSVNLHNIQVRLVCLAKNYGHHKAIFAGIRDVNEDIDYLVIIDSDGEESPKYIVKLIEEITNSKLDCILTFQSMRPKKSPNRLLAFIADTMLVILSSGQYIKGVCTLRIMKKHVAQSLARNRDENPVLGIAQQRLGLKFSKIEIEKKYKGSSTYTLNSRFKLFIRIFRAIPKSYSKFATWIGIAGMGCFILAFIWFMACGFFSNDSLPGESLLVPIIILVSGIGIFLLSIVTKLLVNRKNSIYEFSEVVIKDSYDIS